MKTLLVLLIASTTALFADSNVIGSHQATQSQIDTAYQNYSNYMAQQGQPLQQVQPAQQYFQPATQYIQQGMNNAGYRPTGAYQTVPANNSTLGTIGGVANSGLGAYQSLQNKDYVGAGMQGLDAIQQLMGSEMGSKVMGSVGNALNGTLGQGASSAASGAAGSAGSSAGGAAGSAGSSGGGAGGAGAAVMDIGNIIQGMLQNMQLGQQTGIQTNQLSTLTNTLDVNSKDLAVTRAINSNIGVAPAAGGMTSSLGNSSVAGILGGGGGSSGSMAGGGSGTTGGMSSIMQAGSQVGNFLSDKMGSMWDLFSSAKNIIGSASNFANDPVGTARDILSMLFGGNPSNRLAEMSAEEMMQAGVAVPGAMASSYNSGILSSSAQAVSANNERLQRIAALNQSLAQSKSLNETAAIQSQIGIEAARMQNEQIAQQATQTQAAAANNERAIQLEMQRRQQQNGAMMNQ